MRDTWPLLDKIPFPAIRARAARHAAGQCRLSLQPVLRALPRQCRARTAPRRWTARRRRPRARLPGAAAHRDARHHRRRAGAQSAFPPAGDRARATWACSVMDRCNLTDPGAAGPGRPRRIPRRASRSRSSPRCPATCEDNVDKPARQGRVRRLDPRPAAAQRARLRPRRLGPDAQSRLQSAGPVAAAAAGGARGRLQARARRALRHRVQQPLHARQHADPALRRDPAVARASSTRYLDTAAARASRRQPRRRDVPQPDLGRLSRLRLRLRLQPDARPAARARRRASACICPTCSTTTSPAIRSASPAIASAAPPARARAAAAR